MNIVENLTIVGVSSHLDDLIAEGRILGSSRPCNIIGTTYPPSGKAWRGGGSGFVTEYRDIDFQGFDSTGECDATAIEASNTQLLGRGTPFAMDAPTFDNISFDSASDRISICSAVAAGVQGFALNNVTGAGGGFLVQDNYAALTAFLPPSSCQPMETGSCLSSCPSTCFRHMWMEIPGSEIHDGKQMIVTDAVSGASALVPREVRTDITRHTWRDAVSLYLPNGSYSVSFVEADGVTPTWPGYAYLKLGSAPSCTDFIEEADVTIDYPAPNARCDNPVHNGDLELGDSQGWQDVASAGMEMFSPGADGTGHALRTTKLNRPAGHGLWNHIDVR